MSAKSELLSTITSHPPRPRPLPEVIKKRFCCRGLWLYPCWDQEPSVSRPSPPSRRAARALLPNARRVVFFQHVFGGSCTVPPRGKWPAGRGGPDCRANDLRLSHTSPSNAAKRFAGGSSTRTCRVPLSLSLVLVN